MILVEPGSSTVLKWMGLAQMCTQLIMLLRKRRRKRLVVLHRSENFIIVNKESDLLINSNDPSKTSLELALCDEFPSLANPSLRHRFHFVHRLDYVTSGVICIGLNRKASSAAATAFENRLASKYYLALVRGHVSAELVEIDVPIGEMKSELCGNHRMIISDDKEKCLNPRPSTTRLLVLERGIFDGYPATKLILQPITGRRHQLRVHCAHMGHTIIGDFTYSCRKDTNPKRTYLHAFRLRIPNAVESLDFQTSDPFSSVDGWIPIEKLNDIDDSTFSKLRRSFDVNDSNIRIK